MKEREIEAILVSEVKQLGGRAFKWVSPGNNGVPDRIVILQGQCPIFVELKTDTGILSSLQKIQCKRLLDLGQRVEIVRGMEGLILFFQLLGQEEISEKLSHQYGKQKKEVHKRLKLSKKMDKTMKY